MALRIGVLGHRQSAALALYLRTLLPDEAVTHVEPGPANATPAQRARIAEQLARCDHVITPELPDAYGPLATAALRPRARRLHVLPAVRFAGFHPDVIAVPVHGRPLGGPTGALQSRLAVLGYLAGLGVADTVQLYNRLSFSRLGYLRAYAEQAALLREEFARFDLDGAALLAAWHAHGCFMHAPTRPRPRVLLDLAYAACAKMQIAPTDRVITVMQLTDLLADGPTHPLFPDIAAAAGVPPEGAFRPHGRQGVPRAALRIEHFVAQSFARFAAVPIESLCEADGVAAGLAALGLPLHPARRGRALGPDMALLTWHGTLLRQAPAGGTPTHLAVAVPPQARPLVTIDFPDPARRHGFDSPALGGVRVDKGPNHAVISLWQRGRALCAERDVATAAFSRGGVDSWEGFLPLSQAEAAALHTLVTHDWVAEATGETVAATDVALLPGFRLRFGRWELSLLNAAPQPAAPARDGSPRVAMLLDGAPVLMRGAGAEVAAAAPPETLSPDAPLIVPGPPELLHLPLMVSNADRRWLFDAYDGPPPVPAGWHRYGAVLRRAADALLQFDIAGVASPLPETAAPAARKLPGQIVLATAPGQSAHAAWVEVALRLFVLGPYLEDDALLLLPPGGVAPPLAAAWHAIGVGQRALAAPPGPCHVADLVWLAQENTALLPGQMLRAFRDKARHVAVALPGAERTRVFVHGLGPPPAAALLARAVTAGFRPIDLARLPPLAQLAAFAAADWVVGASGPDLAGLVFCASGTRVIEIAPQEGFVPFAWMLAGKLRLLHAVLPGGTPERFAALAAMLENFNP